MKSNYEIMQDRMRERFLSFDTEVMVKNYNLKQDEDYIYIMMFSRSYRIAKKDGIMEWSADGWPAVEPATMEPATMEPATVESATMDEAGTIYDLLCSGTPILPPSGEYVSVESLSSLKSGTTSHNLGDGLFAMAAKSFDKDIEGLRRACEELHGIPEGKGDVAYRIPFLDFMDMRLSFWASDDEFPAQVKFFWDPNILNYIHYETIYYACSALLDRLKKGVTFYQEAGE